MKKFLTIVMISASFVFFISCGGKSSTTEKPAKEEGKPAKEGQTQGGNSNIAVLTNEQIKSIEIEWGPIEQKQLTASIKANGVLKVPNQNKASVNSVYSGVIRSLLIQPGNTVRKGQTIATIANPEFIQAQSQYLGLNAKIIFAELEVKRQKELNEGNAGALKNLQSAEAELRTLQTLRSTLAQEIELMGVNPSKLSNGKLISVLTVTSPINGVVSDVKVRMGSYVDVTTVVAEIVDNREVHLDLFVYEKDLPKLENKQVIHFTVTNNPITEYDAEIFSLGSSFEGESKAVTVHAKVAGQKTGLIDGMNVTAIISLNQTTVPAVPSDAIVNVDGQDYIFLLANGNDVHLKGGGKKEEEKGKTFERIPVAKGTSDVGYTEITLLKELPKDARVVTKGAFFVSAKMTNLEKD